MQSVEIQDSLYIELERDPWNFLKLSQEQLFSLDTDRVKKIQLSLLKRRFDELRPKLRGLRHLAEDVELEQIQAIEDIGQLGMPHTMFKSYSALDVKEARFDKLTSWLQSLTTHDLSKVDASDCKSIEAWLQRLEQQSALRPVTSSGTSGKISIFPISTDEETLFIDKIAYIVAPFADETGIDAKSGDFHFICPWPARVGRHNIPFAMRLLQEHCYGGSDEKFITLGDGTVTADEMWLSGQLQRAQGLGETLDLTPAEKEIARLITERAAGAKDRWAKFIEKAVVQMKGKKVLFYGAWMTLYQMATACRERGIVVEWDPGSIILTGGGTKGFSFPDDWMDVVTERFPGHVPDRIKEVYGMTESSATAVACSHNKLHPMPWGIFHLVDPETGESLPRTGTQFGRMIVFDPIPDTFWTGTITGDAVTMHYDGGCGCGRTGPFMDNDITRLSERAGGDDKITCARTPQAFERLEEFLSASS